MQGLFRHCLLEGCFFRGVVEDARLRALQLQRRPERGTLANHHAEATLASSNAKAPMVGKLRNLWCACTFFPIEGQRPQLRCHFVSSSRERRLPAVNADARAECCVRAGSGYFRRAGGPRRRAGAAQRAPVLPGVPELPLQFGVPRRGRCQQWRLVVIRALLLPAWRRCWGGWCGSRFQLRATLWCQPAAERWQAGTTVGRR